jgi:hypothetical protein
MEDKVKGWQFDRESLISYAYEGGFKISVDHDKRKWYIGCYNAGSHMKEFTHVFLEGACKQWVPYSQLLPNGVKAWIDALVEGDRNQCVSACYSFFKDINLHLSNLGEVPYHG